jgi:hypothetical protein
MTTNLTMSYERSLQNNRKGSLLNVELSNQDKEPIEFSILMRKH